MDKSSPAPGRAGTFNAVAFDYFASHGIRPEIASAVGVHLSGGLRFPYYDELGSVLFERKRDMMEGKVYQPAGKGLVPWTPVGTGPALIVFEGESDCLAAISAMYEPEPAPACEVRRRDDLPPPLVELTPVALPGAGVCHGTLADLVEELGASVLIAFDGDEAGRVAAGKLKEKIAHATIIDLPCGKDLADLLAAADDPTATLAELIAEAEAFEEVPVEGDAGGAKGEPQEQADEGDRRKPTQAELMLALAHEAGIELWATPEGDPFMTVPVGEHSEHHRLGTRAARDWLSHLFYRSHERPPSAQALQDTLGVLRGQALYDGGRLNAPVRYAGYEGATYLDLGDADWRAVKIDGEGWEIVGESPVRFRRPRGMLPLPEPERGGDLNVLRDLLNVDDAAWTLIAGWLVGVMAPAGPYPVLGLHGEQGAAKSSAARLLRSLVDPNVAPLRSEPRDERDLVIAASNGRIVALDNVSSLSANLSDALCRLATGGGFATRELYSDSEEIIFSAVRPAILTGIGEVTTRGDLLDRSILATLNPIPESDRLTEAELEKRWSEAAPVAFGALLDAASTALRRLDDVHLERLPRMADHARWVTAAEPALGWSAGTYMRVYGEARAAAVETSLDSSSLTEPIRKLAVAGFEGSATDLLAALDDQVGETVTRSRSWPRSARALSSALRRLAPDLRVEDIEVVFTRNESRRVIAIQKGGDSERHMRQTVMEGSEEPDANDANDGADANPGTHSNGKAATPAEEAEVERLAAKLGGAA